uniref:Myb/SANT-like DNA-binding domain-containing protein n=1 Tax=Magallana gigas TaxID=29159 RepID=A0A8W8NVY6_MAGGI
MDSISDNDNAKRQRKMNWDPKEEVVLVKEVSKREQLLFGKLDGPGRTTTDKTNSWKEVMDLLNAGNVNSQRTVPEIKKKYQNIKQKAKEKRSTILHPRTGGGNKPSSPNLSEQLLLDNLERSPSFCGLPYEKTLQVNVQIRKAKRITQYLVFFRASLFTLSDTPTDTRHRVSYTASYQLSKSATWSIVSIRSALSTN